MSKRTLGYAAVGLCSLVTLSPKGPSQVIDGQPVDPSHCQKLDARVPPGPVPGLPGDLLYYVTPLGGLSDWPVRTQPRGINELGQVTGTSRNAESHAEAFLWDPVEGMIGLGDLPAGGFQSSGYAVNNLGHVAGYGEGEQPGVEPTFWTPEDGMISLGGCPGWGQHGMALAINDLDQVVGRGHHLGYGSEAFLWDPELGMIGLGDLAGAQYSSNAEGVNNAGQVTGFSTSGDRPWGEAFIWDKVNGMRPLWGTPPGVHAWMGEGINELGQITGVTNTREAFLWDPQDGLVPLGRFQPGNHPTWACALNDVGQVVGQYDPDGAPAGVFIWDAERGMHDPETLIAAGTDQDYRDLLFAWGINNGGQIIAWPRRTFEGVLLTPFVLGDLNCDELVDEEDIGPLLLLLLHPEEYAQTYPDCPGEWAGDVNQDGVPDFDDLYALRRFLRRPVTARPPRDVHLEPLPPAP